MSRINWGRVFLGGLVAGLVINVSETLLNAVVVKSDWEEAMRALGKDPAAAMAGSAIAIWILSGPSSRASVRSGSTPRSARAAAPARRRLPSRESARGFSRGSFRISP